VFPTSLDAAAVPKSSLERRQREADPRLPGSGTGTWTSSYRRTSGSPYSWSRTAFIGSLAFGIVVSALLAGSVSRAGLIERGVADLDLTVALVVSDHDPGQAFYVGHVADWIQPDDNWLNSRLAPPAHLG
jgi:hypothetical protein